MSLQHFWTLPTRDLEASTNTRRAPGVTDPRIGRFGPFDHLTQIARAAEATGFAGLYIPYDPLGEESWITAIALAREAPRLQLLPEFQPGFATAVYTAKLALSFQRFFADRLSWKLAVHTDDALQRALGDTADPAAARVRADEFITVVDGVWNSSPFTFEGQHFEVDGGGFFEGIAASTDGFVLDRRPRPPLYLDGIADEDLRFSAAHADVHVFDLLDPHELSPAIERLARQADAHGRDVRVALRLSVLAREFHDEAWRDARRLWTRSGATGSFDAHRADDGRWSGFGQLGASTTDGIVGSFDEIAERLATYERLGVTTLLLEGAQHLDDVYRLGEFVLSQLTPRPRTLELQP